MFCLNLIDSEDSSIFGLREGQFPKPEIYNLSLTNCDVAADSALPQHATSRPRLPLGCNMTTDTNIACVTTRKCSELGLPESKTDTSYKKRSKYFWFFCGIRGQPVLSLCRLLYFRESADRRTWENASGSLGGNRPSALSCYGARAADGSFHPLGHVSDSLCKQLRLRIAAALARWCNATFQY